MKFIGLSVCTIAIIVLLQVCFKSTYKVTSQDAGIEPAGTQSSSPEVYFKLGEQYLNNTNRQLIGKALTAYKEAIRLKPDYAEAYLGLGKAYHERHIYDLEREHPKEEIESYLRAIELKPNLAEAYVCLGNTFQNDSANTEESIRKATELYNKALQVDPGCATAYEELCGVYLFQKRFLEAEEATKQALLINPESRRSLRVLNDSCWIGGRCQEVIRLCEELAQVQPNNIALLLVTARGYYKLGHIDDSISTYRRLIKLAPDQVEAHYELGSAYLAQGDKQAASEEYNHLRRIESKASSQINEVYGPSAKKLLEKINNGRISLID